jgi:hypothetical protein
MIVLTVSSLGIGLFEVTHPAPRRTTSGSAQDGPSNVGDDEAMPPI